MNDPLRSNLNLDRAAYIMKGMRKQSKLLHGDKVFKRGHLDSYFAFENPKSVKIVDLSRKGQFLMKNKDKFAEKVPVIVERIWPLYDRDCNGYLDATELGDFI